jgi:PAS domain S-box-containing protein
MSFHRAIIEGMSEGVCQLSPDGCILFANQRLAAMLGTTVEALTDRSAFDFVTLENREDAEERIARCLAGSRELSVLRLCRDDGSSLIVRSSAAPLGGAPGVPPSVIVVLSDITAQVAARKEAERALRQSDARFRRLYESRIIGIVTGTEDTLLEANDLFLEMVGYTREDLEAGRLNWFEMTAPEYRERIEESQREVKTKTFAGPFEREYIRKDGTRIPVLAGVTLLDENPFRALCFALDLTEMKKLERKLLESQKLESVSLLAAGIAHQFNNLLVSVIGNASLGRGSVPTDHPARGMMERVVEAGQQAAYLTRQLLAYCGKGAFQVEPIEMGVLLPELAGILRPSLSKKIALHLDLHPQGCSIEADRGHIQQIFMNLVWNAAEAIGSQQGAIVIRCESCQLDRAAIERRAELAGAEPGAFVCLSVSDTGCGMDETTRAKIYDPFFSTKFVGRGLGLAAVAGIVRTLRGAIDVTSSPGQGSEFRILLPSKSSAAEPVKGPQGVTTSSPLV